MYIKYTDPRTLPVPSNCEQLIAHELAMLHNSIASSPEYQQALALQRILDNLGGIAQDVAKIKHAALPAPTRYTNIKKTSMIKRRLPNGLIIDAVMKILNASPQHAGVTLDEIHQKIVASGINITRTRIAHTIYMQSKRKLAGKIFKKHDRIYNHRQWKHTVEHGENYCYNNNLTLEQNIKHLLQNSQGLTMAQLHRALMPAAGSTEHADKFYNIRLALDKIPEIKADAQGIYKLA